MVMFEGWHNGANDGECGLESPMDHGKLTYTILFFPQNNRQLSGCLQFWREHMFSTADGSEEKSIRGMQL
jgi:hypothetical protein